MSNSLTRVQYLYGKDGIERLNECRVAIVGVGGVGSHTAECLARSGIGSLLLIDHDRVDITNINRQIPALFTTIGSPKVRILEERFYNLREPGSIRIKSLQSRLTVENIPHIVPWKEIDVLIDCIDDIPAKVTLLAEGVRHGVLTLSALGAANKDDPTAFCMGSVREAIICPLARRTLERLKRDFGNDGSVIACVYSTAAHHDRIDKQRGTIGPMPAIEGYLLASILLRALSRKTIKELHNLMESHQNWWDISPLDAREWSGAFHNIHLDANSSTRILPNIRQKLNKYYSAMFDDNRIDSVEALRNAECIVLRRIGCEPPPSKIQKQPLPTLATGLESYNNHCQRTSGSIVWTSGATEAIHQFIDGLVYPDRQYTSISDYNYDHETKDESKTVQSNKLHFILSTMEHAAVWENISSMIKRHPDCIRSATWSPKMSNSETWNIDELKQLLVLDSNVRNVVLLTHAHNETGIILPIHDIVKQLRETCPDTFIFIDTTQTMGKLPIDVVKWNVDGICGSGHKMYGPPHTGFLWTSKRYPISPSQKGMGLQYYRGGTISAHLFSLMVEAMEWCYSSEALLKSFDLEQSRNRFESSLTNLEHFRVIGKDYSRLYNTSLISISDSININRFASFLKQQYNIIIGTGPFVSTPRWNSGVKSNNYIRISFGLYSLDGHVDQLLEAMHEFIKSNL